MSTNSLLILKGLGQSIWLDYIQRALLTSGEFQRLIDEDGVSGVTSNPAILKKAIVEHHDYDEAIRSASGIDAQTLYERLAIEDLRHAADLLLPVYEASQKQDGYVSLEVSPYLADKTDATIDEARRLWHALDRPNSLIKVPGTKAGIPAIQQLISDGININVTLLFGLPRYEQVVLAYLAGLEARAARGEAVTSIASVASFFLSRIDTLVDSKLSALGTSVAQPLRGQAAIASAKIAHEMYKRRFSGARWQPLEAAGARPQRLLWASTSTKDPAYSDVKYVEALIGAGTINTLPLETIDAYRDHGQPMARLESDITLAQRNLAGLAELGIDLASVTDQLEKEGVEKFSVAFAELLRNLQQRIG